MEESKAEMMEELSEGEAQKAAFGEQLGATTGEAGQVVGLVVERVAVRAPRLRRAGATPSAPSSLRPETRL